MNNFAELAEAVEAEAKALDLREGVTFQASTGVLFGEDHGTYLQFAFKKGCCANGSVDGIPWDYEDNCGDGVYGSQCSECGAQGLGYLMSTNHRVNTEGIEDLREWVREKVSEFYDEIDEWIQGNRDKMNTQLEAMVRDAAAGYRKGLAEGWGYDPDLHDNVEEAKKEWLKEYGIFDANNLAGTDLEMYCYIDEGHMVAEGIVNHGEGIAAYDFQEVRVPLDA